MTARLTEFWNFLKKNPWTGVALLVIAVFSFLRVWRLSFPGETVFDEVYFPKMASQYLAGEAFFDIHPPLGKLIIALGEMMFGNTTIGWRIMPLLAGLALLPASYWTMMQLFDNRKMALVSVFLLSIEGLFIVYARTGLMDGFIALFGILAIGFCWRFVKKRLAGDLAWGTMIATGFFAGLALAVKWIGAGFLPLAAIAVLIVLVVSKKRNFQFSDFFIWFIAFAVIPFLLYTLPFLANWQTDFWNQFFTWHKQSWDYNVHLDATHPYASKWWSWPFLTRPIWFYYKVVESKIIGVDGIGNPIVWWGTTLGIVFTLLTTAYTFLVWNRKDSQVIERRYFWPVLFLLAGWAAFYLPWTVIGRVLFLYHYMSSYLFALLLASFWLGLAFEGKWNKVWVVALLAVASIVGLYFAPIWIAYPISQGWFDNLMWFKSWI